MTDGMMTESSKEHIRWTPELIDLCSGLGRWDRGDVVSVDFDRKTRPTVQADIRYLPFRRGLGPRHLHASPPCTYISKARRWRWGWNPKGIAQSLRLLAACYDAADYLDAENVSIEQPAGIELYLGRKVQFKYDKADIRNTTTNFYLGQQALRRSIIPQDVREKLLEGEA